MSRLIDVSTWLAKIPHCPTGGLSFWDYFWCWNPAAVVNRDLNGISQRGGSGEQAWSQGSVPGFCRPTANGRFERRQRTVKKKNLTKTLSSCSSRTAIFSNIPTFLHSLVQSRTYILTKSANVRSAFYAVILNRKIRVKQSSARTITRTPTHTLSCILEDTMAWFPFKWHSDNRAKSNELKVSTFCEC